LISGEKVALKQQRRALLGQVAQDALQVGQEADVQHAVGLVQHHVLDLVEHRVLGLDVVQQAARRGHQHLDARFQLGVCGFMSMPPNTTALRSWCTWHTA
jgi:hypothetical protein